MIARSARSWPIAALWCLTLPLHLLGAQGRAWERPEASPEFRRQNAPIVTVRITGESSPGFQVTLFATDGAVTAIVQEERSSGSRETRLVEAKVCKPLLVLLEEFRRLEIPLNLGTEMYFPSRTYQLWVSGLTDEIYLKVSTPAPDAEGYAYWGEQQSRLHSVTLWSDRLRQAIRTECRAKEAVE